MLLRLRLAIGHARRAIWLMAMIYAVSIAAGIAMAHSNNRMALRFRDTLVRRANRTDPAARADAAGAHARAAALDFSRDLVLVAFPDTVGGLTLILPVALGAYRGWVGGLFPSTERTPAGSTMWNPPPTTSSSCSFRSAGSSSQPLAASISDGRPFDGTERSSAQAGSASRGVRSSTRCGCTRSLCRCLRWAPPSSFSGGEKRISVSATGPSSSPSCSSPWPRCRSASRSPRWSSLE